MNRADKFALPGWSPPSSDNSNRIRTLCTTIWQYLSLAFQGILEEAHEEFHRLYDLAGFRYNPPPPLPLQPAASPAPTTTRRNRSEKTIGNPICSAHSIPALSASSTSSNSSSSCPPRTADL